MMTTAVILAFAALTTDAANESDDMKKFVLVVRVPETYTSEQAKAVNPKWDKTIEYWKAVGAYVESFAFPRPGYVISGTDKQATAGSIAWGGQIVVSIVVLQAENIAQATELAKRCPILDHGGTVEVRERPR
ncbi:hypothetical protein [Parapedobacter sp. DT-150]|uniref:hypothetical protein n=1 Tax=Parapedobacter sp. DT-150 TaxID=3396162 RepID=UPI003F1D933D